MAGLCKKIFIRVFILSLTVTLVSAEEAETGNPGISKKENHSGYPRLEISIGAMATGDLNYFPGLDTGDIFTNYQRNSIYSRGPQVGVDWFFKKDLGLTFEIDRSIVEEEVADYSGIKNRVNVGVMYKFYTGIKYRLLFGTGIPLGKEIYGEKYEKKGMNFCCSVFGEIKVGQLYLDFDQKYREFVSANKINILPLSNPGEAASGMALKFRFGFIVYFPQIFLETGAAGSAYLFKNSRQITGFNGLEVDFTAGVYF